MPSRAGLANCAWLVAVVALFASGCAKPAIKAAPAPTTSRPNSTTVAGPSGGDDWLGYAHDASRSGVDALAPAAGKLTREWTASLDGAVLAEPLVAGGKVLVATEHDTVEALDSTSGALLWSTHLGTPVAGSALPCGDIDPSGVTATPVVDLAHSLMWVVAFVERNDQRSHRLFALRLDTGAVASERAADLPGVDPSVEQERGALSIVAGRVIIPYGGLFGDCGSYHGALLGLSVDGSGAIASWTVPSAREGGIWAPPGAVVAPDGSILVSTGNAASESVFDDANAVVRLGADLVPRDLWAPSNWQALSAADQDESSTSPVLLSDGDVVSVGKEGTGYLLAGAHLGGIGGQEAAAAVCTGAGAYGGTATAGSVVYEPCRDGLVALQVGPGPALSVRWKAAQPSPGAPVLAGGLIWSVDRAGTVVGLDPDTGAVRQQAALGRVGSPFPSLAASGGRLFVPAGSTVVAFGGI